MLWTRKGYQMNFHEQKCKCVPKLTAQQKQRLWAKIDKHGPNECWPWLGSCGHKGRGQFIIGGQNFRPHRVVFAIRHGDPGPYPVTQTCGTRACCNPKHLKVVKVQQ